MARQRTYRATDGVDVWLLRADSVPDAVERMAALGRLVTARVAKPDDLVEAAACGCITGKMERPGRNSITVAKVGS
jgi:hypothetical protein